MLAGLRHFLQWVTQHTGIPVVVVAAVLLVVSWKLAKYAKRARRLALEIAVVTALLLLATHFGWIRW